MNEQEVKQVRKERHYCPLKCWYAPDIFPYCIADFDCEWQEDETIHLRNAIGDVIEYRKCSFKEPTELI